MGVALTKIEAGHYRYVAAPPLGFDVWRRGGSRWSAKSQCYIMAVDWCWRVGSPGSDHYGFDSGYGTKQQAAAAALRFTLGH